MGFLLHLHRHTAIYKWLLPLTAAACIGALIFACFWENKHFWALIVASALVLLVAVGTWTLLLWGIGSVRLMTDHPYDYNFQGSAVRLYDFKVEGKGSVKVLEIDHDNADMAKEGAYVEVGKALGPAMVKMRWGLWVFHFLVMSVVRSEDIDRLLEMLPELYVNELKDLAEGVRQVVPRRSFLSRWTIRDWFAVQLIPDLELLVSHINPCDRFLKKLLENGNERRVRLHPAVGCTALLTERGFFRLMDWPTLGLMGQFTLLVRRQYLNTGAVSLEIGVPGLIGTVTGVIAWNPVDSPQNRGMVAMNVCFPHNEAKWIQESKRYLPASYVNRAVLSKLADERCESSDIHNLSAMLANYQPLAPYHITFAKFVDGGFSGVMVHCLQDGQSGHAYRRFPQEGADFLLTCNGNLTERRESDPQSHCFTVRAHDLMHTNARTAKIQDLLKKGETDGRTIVSQAPVNNHETCYMVALEHDFVELRVDNSFGASAEPINITDALLGSPLH